MSMVNYIDEKAEKLRRKTERLRQKQFNEGYLIGYSEGHTEVRAWNERRLQAQERGEPFDEPFPDEQLED